MPLSALKKLPAGARNMFESVYRKLKDEGYSDSRASKIAWGVVKKHYKSVKTAKSAVMAQSYENTPSSNVLKDVLFGFSEIDKDGERLSDDFWKNIPQIPISGDLEHIHKRKAEGEYVDYPSEWDGWVPIADNFKYKDGKLYGDVELPKNHPMTEKFLVDWNNKEYGVSVEYAYPEEAEQYQWEDNILVPTITAGTITNWAFTKDPAINTKKNE